MTADEVKDALRRRHPALQYIGGGWVPGAWVCLEEHYADLVAFSCHATPASGAVPGVRYPRVGYEVKVSRSDYRRELLKPHKRRRAVEWCNAFYLAVPRGLLTKAELAYREPEWAPADFVREPCTAANVDYYSDPGRCLKGERDTKFVGPLPEHNLYRWHVQVPCTECGGRGYAAKSRVEREAPTLWVPADVGLIEVDGRGARVTRQAPVRREVAGIDGGGHLNTLIRFVSSHPDPRHATRAW